MAILELSKPFGRAHPLFSCIPLPQCNLQVVCSGERLHVTVFGKTASLSLERASNCTCLLYSGRKRFQVFMYGVILGFVKSHGVSPIQYSSSIGLTIVKNTAFLPLLRLFSSWDQSVSDYLIQFTRVPDVVDVLGKSSFGNRTFSCKSGSMALSPECP